ncbi:hypothetical protein OBBRIDRAFT_475532 [Obba rivulosa]|uniref:SH3 domain-containing protein n=1 Tax=Obba rivulosa TaxID=1052685 RepID=A0A8E2B1G4_9APHY|nr:hypothetical protein OBBRIDRAFT_475532 [Obba rivulosa]
MSWNWHSDSRLHRLPFLPFEVDAVSSRAVSIGEVQRREVTTSPISTAAVLGLDAAVNTSVASRSSGSFSTSKKIWVAFIAVLGLVIFGLAVWRIWVLRSRKNLAGLKLYVAAMEKKRGVKGASVEPDSDDQLSEKSAVRQKIHFPTLPVPSLKRPTLTKQWARLHGPVKSVEKDPDFTLPTVDYFERSPPSYAFIDIGAKPSAPKTAIRPQIVITVHSPSDRKALPAVKSTHMTDSPILASPLRTASFGPYNLSPAAAKPKTALPSERLPRLMVVENTFQPSLPDELTIFVGETLRMFAEYEDDWCLVRRTGDTCGQLGVVPRFCLRERSDS